MKTFPTASIIGQDGQAYYFELQHNENGYSWYQADLNASVQVAGRTVKDAVRNIRIAYGAPVWQLRINAKPSGYPRNYPKA